MFLNVGQGLIDPIMNHEKLSETHLAFVFPERWMGQTERQAFTYCLSKHPDVKVVKQLGKKAGGDCSSLEIVDVPEGLNYTIEEYDGNEWVAESHRTWR